jgi:hypothetical protein
MMEIQITNDVRTVRFEFSAAKNQWSIKVNGATIKTWQSRIGYTPIYHYTLEDAIKIAKAKGLIPLDIEVADLQFDTTIVVEGQ